MVNGSPPGESPARRKPMKDGKFVELNERLRPSIAATSLQSSGGASETNVRESRIEY
jgi:hypothetical protein